MVLPPTFRMTTIPTDNSTLSDKPPMLYNRLGRLNRSEVAMHQILDHLVEVILYSVWDVRIGVTMAVVNDFRPAWALAVGTSSSIATVIPSYGLLRRFLLWSRRYLPRTREHLFRLTQKHRGRIEQYGYLGIFLLIAVPLPGTGPWTAALCASLLRMDPVRASMALAGGIIAAGLLSLGIAEGILSLLPFFS